MTGLTTSLKWMAGIALSAALLVPTIGSAKPMNIPEQDIMSSTLFASIDSSEAWVNKMPSLDSAPLVLNQSTQKMQVHLNLNVENLSAEKEKFTFHVYVTNDIEHQPTLKVKNLEVRMPTHWDGVTFPHESVNVVLFGTVAEPVDAKKVIYTVEIEDADGNVIYFKSNITPIQYAL